MSKITNMIASLNHNYISKKEIEINPLNLVILFNFIGTTFKIVQKIKKKYDILKVYNFPMVLPVKGLLSHNNDISFEV